MEPPKPPLSRENFLYFTVLKGAREDLTGKMAVLKHTLRALSLGAYNEPIS